MSPSGLSLEARASRLRVGAALVLLLSGCVPFQLSVLEDNRPPVEVLAIAARFHNETTGELDVRLAFPNRMDEPLSVTGVSWDAWVDGHHFATGLESLSLEIAPLEERVLYLTLPLAFRRMPLRQGPIRLLVGLRGRVTARVGTSEEEQGFPFSRQMEVLSDRVPIFPSPGEVEE